MCAECGMAAPNCSYCGDECYGACEDPDTCPSCWPVKHFEHDVYDEDALVDCLDALCRCLCHSAMYEDDGIRFEAGVIFDEESEPSYERTGVFPFFKLPGEIRDKIYRYAILQDGQQRTDTSHYHRGTIHTVLVQTCRQINEEARTIPLAINRLCFRNPLYALHFFAYRLPPTVASLVKSITIEYHVEKPQYEVERLLMLELGKLDITSLGLTIHGPARKDLIMGHTCFAARFKPLTKLESVELRLGSAHITPAARHECQEYLKTQLVKGDGQPRKGKPKTKRTLAPELPDENVEKSAKMAKKNLVQTRLTKRNTRSAACHKTEDLAYLSRAQLQASLTARFTQLNVYATTLDHSLVRMRLEEAHRAAEAADQQAFDSLARSILDTLDCRRHLINDAHQQIIPALTKHTDPHSKGPASS